MTEIDDRAGEWFAHWFNGLLENVEVVIKGKRDQIAMALVCLFSEGHLLLEDVPGTGKTQLAKAIAHSIKGSWGRVQFTPDLLPADVTGGMIYNQARSSFEFHRGPVFTNVLLADEINRASPKTQAALLEVMEERQVTIDGTSYEVPRPFVVIATQNPVEQEGTYRLPEAQLDRFLMRTRLGYPAHEDEVAVLRSASVGTRADRLEPVLSTTEVERMVRVAGQVHIEDPIHGYIVRIAAATREMPELRLGVSTRGALAMMRSSRALAASQGRIYVTVDDVKAVAPAVMAHRMLLSAEAELKSVRTADLVERVLDTVEAPGPIRTRG